MIQARVVDLPLPAGPVTRTIPLFVWASSMTESGILRSLGFGSVNEITRMTAEYEPRCLNVLTR